MMQLTELQKETILAFAECDMNYSETGRKTYVARNTLIYRLEKIHRVTGLNPKRFYDLVKLVDMARESEPR